MAAEKRIDWLQRQHPFTRHPYRQLAKVLREAGDDSGWRRVATKMQEKVWRARGWIMMPLSLLLRATIGYGYSSLRALWWLMGLILFGAVIYIQGYHAGSMVPTDKTAYDELVKTGEVPGYYVPFDPIFYSLENSFPVLRLGMEDKWLPAKEGKTIKTKSVKSSNVVISWAASPPFLLWFRFVQICIGWILATLFVGGVSGLVRKD